MSTLNLYNEVRETIFSRVFNHHKHYGDVEDQYNCPIEGSNDEVADALMNLLVDKLADLATKDTNIHD